MRSHKNSLKQSLIQVRNTLILQEIDELKKKKTHNNFLNKKITIKKEKEDIALRNAYKNIINVITNILDNIEDVKENGKVNMLATQRKIENKNKRKSFKKLISFDVPRIRHSLNIQNSKNENSIEPLKYNTLNTNKSPFNLSINWKSQKQSNIQNYNNTDGSGSELSTPMENSSRKRQQIIKKIYKKFKPPNPNLFFKPKNKLVSGWNSTRNNFYDDKNVKNLLKPVFNRNSYDIGNYINNDTSYKNGSSISSNNPLNTKNNILINSKKELNKNSSICEDNTNTNKEINNSNYSNITLNILGAQEENKSLEPKSPFSSIQPKVQVSDTEESVSQNINETKNSGYTSETSQVISEELLKVKRRNRIKKVVSGSHDFRKIISLKPLRTNLAKVYNKEKKYRCLLAKGYVYDSLDDEEISDEEDINNCYLEPNAIFLYILDSITLISSFIILLYLPIYLSKKLYFCRDYNDNNTIIFYFIDFIYIVDLIVNFYRAYYNFEEILNKKNIHICTHYFKTWLFFDLISSFPIYTLLKITENKCFGESYYDDFKLKNNGKHSHYYNINLYNFHYILLLIKIYIN